MASVSINPANQMAAPHSHIQILGSTTVAIHISTRAHAPACTEWQVRACPITRLVEVTRSTCSLKARILFSTLPDKTLLPS